MKSILFAITALMILISCDSNKKKELAVKRIADSIQQVRSLERENFLADSLRKAVRFDQAMTAFGEIKFGMIRDTVQSIMKKTFDQGKSKVLGAYNYSFAPSFNDAGQLYMLQLQTASESSLQLESSVRAKVDNLKQIITTKYGDPKESFGYPDDFAFVETQIQWTNVWEFDTKTIKIGVAAETEGSRYKVICWIFDDPLRIKQMNRGKDLLKSKIEKAAKDF
ncbi:MAG: hypothetical protein Q8T08_22650 [Ignavibacteria bacterium]|nr:hypothetical protein [Ignavibacteria bacterium]